MRAGGCTVQQALNPEAASVVKQAVNLARRRGHAQVTPLHVANTMLSSSTGLLRAACLQSHSHPLQCKALELCFNVALNRLPASTSSTPMLSPHHHHHHHHHHPSLSNALVAAFKRAQAHQRRGSIESQQQPLLAVKIELEQLIISILDDPSVSRVMREAGFSSTQVKSNVEQAVSLDICASAPSNPSPSKPKEVASPFNPPQATKITRPSDQVRSEDVASVLEILVGRKKRSLVIVGECLATTEGVVRGVMDRVDKGEVHEVLRNLQFITLPLFSFRHMSREEVDQKIGELRCLVKSCVGRGAMLYLGDLKWAAEYRASCGEKGRNYYCPVEHVIMEIRSLVYGGIGGETSSSPRFWMMGIATYQTYMKCRIGHPSLEAFWGLHPLTIPVGSLGLSLNCDSDPQNQLTSKRNGDGSCWLLLEDGSCQLTCCADCSIKFETEARSLPNTSYSIHGSITSSLPSWLQQYKKENRRTASDDQDCLQLKDLCKKWNSICSTSHRNQHHPFEMTLNFSAASPSSSSISSYDLRYPTLHQSHHSWSSSLEARQPWRDHQLWISETVDEGCESNSRIYSLEHMGQRTSPLSFSNPKTKPHSTSSSGAMDMEISLPKFKELNAENLKTLCNALEKQVAWQKDIIPEIASTILQCRSRMIRRKEKSRSTGPKEETWLFFQGGDTEGKEKIARELASLVFCSPTNFISIGLSTFAATLSDSTDDLRNKRSRAEVSHNYLERLFEAIRENRQRVILLEDIEQVDYYSQKGIKTAIERGRIQSYNGEEVGVGDAIIILSCESFDSRSRVCSPPAKQKAESEEEKEESCEKEIGSRLCLDLNLCAGDEDVEDCSLDDVGFLQLVDGAFFFKLPEDL